MNDKERKIARVDALVPEQYGKAHQEASYSDKVIHLWFVRIAQGVRFQQIAKIYGVTDTSIRRTMQRYAYRQYMKQFAEKL